MKGNSIKTLKYLLLLLLLIFSCKERDEINRTFPKVTTLSVEDITENGAHLWGMITGYPLENIIDHGFIYGIVGSESVRVSLGKIKNNEEKFYFVANKNLFNGKNYTVKAFAQTESNMVIGDETRFLSKGGLPPVVRSFAPLAAAWGDTISVSGDNFTSILKNNSVKFDTETAKLVFASDTLLKVIVPEALNVEKSTITVSSNEKATTVSKQFEIAKPLILAAESPVKYGGVFVITVKNIKSGLTSFSIDNNPINSVQAVGNKIFITVPKTYAFGLHQLKAVQFGNAVTKEFLYNAPYITNVLPKQLAWGNPLNIIGRNFTAIPSNTLIFFSGENCLTGYFKIVNDTLITLPALDCIQTRESSLKLQLPELTLLAPSSFQIKPPELIKFDHSSTTVGETISAEGINISNGDLSGYLDDKPINPTNRDATHFQFTVPGTLDAGKHKFKMVFGEISSNTIEFEIKKLAVTSFKSKRCCRGGVLTIYGENFGKYNNSVFIDNQNTEFLSNDVSSITVRIPTDPELKITANPVVIVKTGLQNVTVPDKVALIEPWEKISEFSAGFNAGAKFTIGNKFYFSTGNSQNGEFYCYNADNNSWKRIADYPGGRIIKPVCFTLNENAYIGLGEMKERQKFWCYNSNNNQWYEIAPCPVEAHPSNYGFGINQTGYVGDGYGKIYRYSAQNDIWSLGHTQGINLSYSFSKNAGFSYLSKGYLMCGDYASVYVFDQPTDTWDWSSYSYMYAYYLTIVPDGNAITYDRTRNRIFVNGFYYYTSHPTQIYYWDFNLKHYFLFFPSIFTKNMLLFSSNEGGLYLMTNNNPNDENRMSVYKFNFDKYELIKDQMNEN